MDRPDHSVFVPRDLATVVGRHVQQLREQRKWTVYELAERAGLTWHTVDGVEKGSNKKAPRLDTLLQLAGALELCSIELLLGGTLGTSLLRDQAQAETSNTGP
jgi:transcriptional regulator with XRE-family HTH domain